MNAHRDFIHFFRTTRVVSRKSQKDVAAALGLTTGQFISNIERGRAMPPLKRSKEYAKAIGANHKEFNGLLELAMTEKIRQKLGLKRNSK